MSYDYNECMMELGAAYQRFHEQSALEDGVDRVVDILAFAYIEPECRFDYVLRGLMIWTAAGDRYV